MNRQLYIKHVHWLVPASGERGVSTYALSEVSALDAEIEAWHRHLLDSYGQRQTCIKVLDEIDPEYTREPATP